GWDYTLRLELETGTENLLLKDWYINSSKYFLSDGDYNDKVNQGNSMVGYFKYGTPAEIAAKSTGVLQTMNEFRLY
ncbi:hypothetical protein, partial [Klebsiella pneumoniae]|uniref:hypothetical protein n=1 Tax=Klebsiella pneumoniae TaxID=573 RepID=UPI003EE19A99